ncbi:MAG: serine hydrolase [Maricaulaceae bacterium]
MKLVQSLFAVAAATCFAGGAIAQDALTTDRHAAARAAGFRALHLCTGLFSSGQSRETLEATRSASSGDDDAGVTIDETARTVSVTYIEDMPPRIAVWRPNLGCAQLPVGATLDAAANLRRFPEDLAVPDFDAEPWPMGEVDAVAAVSPEIEAALSGLLDEAFADEDGAYGGDTWGVAVVQDGRIIAERYAEGFGPHISARTNSMCKSAAVSLVGVGVQQGLVDIHQPAPLEEWRTPGDPRGAVTINDMLHMASGLYTEAGGNPQSDIYGVGAPPSEVSALNMVTAPPNGQFVYAGSDTILSVRAVREAYGDDETWISWPHREFFWKIGMTRTFIETDWRNDFLASGQCWSTVRDFARFGLLYLADGVWDGERILPEGWAEYVRTEEGPQPGGTYAATGRGYGAQFWTYDGVEGLPADAHSAAGAYGQYAMIVPSENLVVVRRGFDYRGGFNIAKFSADVIAALED